MTNCNSDTFIPVTVSLSLVVFTLSSLLFFILGLYCCQFSNKLRRRNSEAVIQTQSNFHNTIYEDIPPDFRELDQDLELQQNMAYGPGKSTFTRLSSAFK